jgi:predicted exporter
MFGRAIRGAEAGAVAAVGVALSFFVLDLIRIQPMGTPGTLSGAVFGPAGLEWDFTTMSGFVAGLLTAFRITTFTLLHFLSFALVGVLASVLFDWRRGVGLKALLAVAVLCTVAFSATVAGSGSVVGLETLGPITVVGVNLFAALLLAGFLRLAAMPEPEEVPPA